MFFKIKLCKKHIVLFIWIVFVWEINYVIYFYKTHIEIFNHYYFKFQNKIVTFLIENKNNDRNKTLKKYKGSKLNF